MGQNGSGGDPKAAAVGAEPAGGPATWPRRDVLDLLYTQSDALPAALARIAQYVLENPEMVVQHAVGDLSRLTGTGQATVVRFCRWLGFKGFKDFKLALAGELARLPIASGDGDVAGSVVDRLYDNTLAALQETQALIDHDALDRAAALVADARRVHVFGAGVSGMVAEMLAYELARAGLASYPLRDPAVAREIAHTLGPGTVVIGLSASGITAETVQIVRQGRASGAATIALTNRRRSPIAAEADVVLMTAYVDSPLTPGALTAAPSQIHVSGALMTRLVLKGTERTDPQME